MKTLIISILTLINVSAYGQVARCFCEKDTLMNGATVSCDTTDFDNQSKIYWQYNCDSIWLTLENKLEQKIIIDQVQVDLFNLTFRLGYHLIKEFDQSLLFRSGCPANGPCRYILIDKKNGQRIKEFHQLICIDTDVAWKKPQKYQYDFVVYLSYDSDKLVVYFIESKKTIRAPFNEKLNSVIPEQQFDKLTVENEILNVWYLNNLDELKKVEIDLKK